MDGNRAEQISGIIGVSGSWDVREETGELVEVLIPGGRGEGMKMRKSEAIRLGLWKEPDAPSEQKAQQPKLNKQRRPAANKGA